MLCTRRLSHPVAWYRPFAVVYGSSAGGGVRKHLSYGVLSPLHVFGVKASSLLFGNVAVLQLSITLVLIPGPEISVGTRQGAGR